MTFIPNVYGVLSSNNSTTTPLGIGAVFTGVGDEVLDYNAVSISVFTDQDSETNGFSIQFSSNNTNWDFETQSNVNLLIAQQITVPSIARYFRVVYTNGSIAQGVFRLQSILTNGKGQNETRLNTSGLETFSNTRLIGQNVDSSIERVRTVGVDSEGHLLTRIDGPKTAFGDLSVEQGVIQDTLSFQYNINPALMVTSVTGTGSVTKSSNFGLVATGTTTGSTAILRSIRSINYIPGIGINTRFTGIFSTPVTGTTILIGYGTTTNGFFFGYNGTTFGIISRSNSVDTFVAQTSWNKDKMNGTGQSNLTINPQFGNVYCIQFQWLGFGAINFFIENTNTGDFMIVHQIKYANTATVTSTLSPNGYLRMEANNGATTSNVSIKSPSMSVKYESPPNLTIGARFSSSVSGTVSANLLQSILSIRNKSTFQSITNFVPIILNFLSISTAGNKASSIRLIYNQTAASLTYTDISTNQSVMESSSTIATITDGVTLQSFYLGATDSKVIDLNSTQLYLSPGDSITFAVFTTNATNDNGISVSWTERF